MEPKALVYRTWDELVFENRNKAYGAYVLRRSYDDKVLLGFGISVALIILLLFLPKDGKQSIVPRETVYGGYIELDQPPVLDLPKPKPTMQQTVRTQNENLPPLVTTAVVPDVPIVDVPSTPTSSEGNALGGENTASVGVSGGEGETETLTTTHPDFTLAPEVQPYYQGGLEEMMRFIRRKLKYPAAPKRLGIDGTVFVSFIINGDGTVRNVEVIRGIHPDCDREAARVIGMLPGWVGGKQGGLPVAVKMVLPIKFVLD
jgi:periplasmic protein TonB